MNDSDRRATDQRGATAEQDKPYKRNIGPVLCGSGPAPDKEVLQNLGATLYNIIGPENDNIDEFVKQAVREIAFFAVREVQRPPNKKPFEEGKKLAKSLCRSMGRVPDSKANYNVLLDELHDLLADDSSVLPKNSRTFLVMLQRMLGIYEEACNRSLLWIDEQTNPKGGAPKRGGYLKIDFALTIAKLFDNVLREPVTCSMPGFISEKAKFARVLQACFDTALPGQIYNLRKIVEAVCKERRTSRPKK